MANLPCKKKIMINENKIFEVKKIKVEEIKKDLYIYSILQNESNLIDLTKDDLWCISFYKSTSEYIDKVLKLFNINEYCVINVADRSQQRKDIFFHGYKHLRNMNNKNCKKRLTNFNQKLVSL